VRLPHRDDPATWPPKKRWVGPDEVIIPRAEYEALINATDFISILKLKVRLSVGRKFDLDRTALYDKITRWLGPRSHNLESALTREFAEFRHAAMLTPQ